MHALGSRVLLWAGGVGCFFLAAAAPAQRVAAVRPLPEVPAVRVQRLSGGEVSLGELAPAVVFVCASWCPSCRRELPEVARLASRAHGAGVELVALSVDEERDAARQLSAQTRSQGLVWLWDPKGQLVGALAPRRMPAAYVVDGEGHIVDAFEGPQSHIERRVLEAIARVGAKEHKSPAHSTPAAAQPAAAP